MVAWLRDLWDAALFRTRPYAEYSDRNDGALRGFLVILAVALLAALPAFFEDFGRAVGPDALEPSVTQAQDEMERMLSQMTLLFSQSGLPAGAREQALDVARQSFGLATDIARKVDALDTTLPKPAGRAFKALGGWLSAPWRDMFLPLGAAVFATWLGYGIWVMLAAKLLGGKSDLVGFFGATALFAVPHALLLFEWIPAVGALLGVAALLWGGAMYVKGVSVSHKFSIWRAAAATALPLLAAFGLALLVGGALVALLVLQGLFAG